MTANSPIQLGVVGLGWPGQSHAKAVANIPHAQLAACADTNEERRNEFAKTFSIPRPYSTLDEMLADSELDAILVCLPNQLHFPASLAALEAGKHVLCEKPPTMNAAEMRVLEEEAARRNLVYFFGRQFRFSPEMIRAKNLIDAGKLGEIYYAKAVWVRERGTPAGIGGWFTDKSRSGGGVLIDLGVHALDGVWYLMGSPKPVSVTGKVFQNFRDAVDVPIFDVEDGAYGFIRFENGAVVHLETSWAANLPDRAPENNWTSRELMDSEIYGTLGTIQMNPFGFFESQGKTVIKAPTEPVVPTDSFVGQMENFLDAIAGKAAPINSARQAVHLMEMLDAMYKSSETSREIAL